MSSSDENDGNFHSHIHLPAIHKHKKSPSTQLVRAGKKLTNKAISRNKPSRNSFISIGSERGSETESEDGDLDQDLHQAEARILNDCVFKNPENPDNPGNVDVGELSDGISDGYDEFEGPENLEGSDSSDEETSVKRSVHRNPIPVNQTFIPQASQETDITDQKSHTNSNTNSTLNGRRSSIFKDILRKVALQDQAYPERSNGDTFIGNILDTDSTLGLSGGGLVPGGTRYSLEGMKIKDEELGPIDEVESDGNSIELRKLDFAQLNDEARNLINVHVPERYRQELEAHQNDRQGSSSDSMEEKKSSETGVHNSDRGLVAPNPDLFLRSEVAYDDNGEFMMLDEDSDMVDPPTKVHAGVLSSLLQLYQNPDQSKSSSSLTYDDSIHEDPRSSTLDFSKIKGGIKLGGRMVKDRILFANKSHSQNSEINPDHEPNGLPSFQNAKPKVHKNPLASNVKVSKRLRKAKRKQEEQLRITVHIADVLQRQKFIMLMCKALMLFGAPTHRLEEYMIMTSRVLEIDGQFIYFPGCMIIAFGDAATRTSEVHLVKCSQGVNLSKLSEAHRIYKGVTHDLMGVEEASVKLTKIFRLRNQYNPWWCVLFYGLGSALVCPFAFGGGWVDLPICFGVGICVGYLQFFVSSMSNLYSSVFEVTASIVVLFIARAIGSINGGNTFCFSAIAQGSLALILPGYIILCGSLELQSRNLVAGSVRMFYAIIYSLFLGFGITLGASLYGWIDKNSVSTVTCPSTHNVDDKFRILFVPAFTTCLALINQAAFSQLPVMIIIGSVGYIGTYFSGLHFKNVTEFTACIGAFIVGILGNLYSRIWKGLAVSAMLPAIFVQVPSGIASQSSLLSGVTTANEITKNSTNSDNSNTGALSFGSAMVEVSVGISVGLFAAALIVYPFGKKRTGLFSL